MAVVAYPTRSVVAYPTRSVVAYPTPSVVAYPTASERCKPSAFTVSMLQDTLLRKGVLLGHSSASDCCNISRGTRPVVCLPLNAPSTFDKTNQHPLTHPNIKKSVGTILPQVSGRISLLAGMGWATSKRTTRPTRNHGAAASSTCCVWRRFWRRHVGESTCARKALRLARSSVSSQYTSSGSWLSRMRRNNLKPSSILFIMSYIATNT